MRWDAGAHYSFKIEVQRASDREYVVKGILLHDDKNIPLAEALLLTPGLALHWTLKAEEKRARMGERPI